MSQSLRADHCAVIMPEATVYISCVRVGVDALGAEITSSASSGDTVAMCMHRGQPEKFSSQEWGVEALTIVGPTRNAPS